jgi:hypothetical protein
MTARLRDALDPSARGLHRAVVVHTHKPDTVQYASGSMHFICEAVNPFLTDRS